MKKVREFIDKKVEPLFVKDGKLKFFYPVYEMFDTIGFTPGTTTSGKCHVRDKLDQKRMMITVVIAMIFPMIFGIYNIGYQANTIIQNSALDVEGWRATILGLLNIGFDPQDVIGNFFYGILYFVPIAAVVFTVGGFCEVLFALLRRHEVTEGFLVSGFLITLTMPATIPLWQVAIGTAFGVIVAKEIFGGVGFNILNPALSARAFLFFAYPAQISGDSVWVAVDGVSKATALSVASAGGVEGLQESGYTILNAFLGFIPGSIGETSTLAILLGAGLLLTTKIGSWRIMLSLLIGMVVTVLFFNLIQGFSDNPMFTLSPLWHLTIGGFSFGLVYMATDPVTATATNKGKFFYGFLIGVLVVLIRNVNPAYPEGIMLAILFMNVFAPLIDHYVLEANINRRKTGYGLRKKLIKTS